MPVRFDVIGTGLTKRVQPTLILSSIQESDGRILLNVGEPCSEEDVAALTAYMENITQTSTFEGIVASSEVFCQDVLAKAKLPPWDKYVRIYANGDWADDLPEDWVDRAHEILRPGEGIGRAKNAAELKHGIDSQESFAAEILQEIDLVRKVIARDATASVAHLAMKLSALMETARLKFTWESVIVLGEKNQGARKKATENSAKNRTGKAQKTYAEWQEDANDRWKKNLHLSGRRMAKLVGDKFRISQNTIRKHLRKPERLSTT